MKTAAESSIPASVQDSTVILSLTFHRFGDRLKLSDDEYQCDAEKKRTGAHKRLLSSEELDAIISLQGAARRAVQRFAVPCHAVRYGRYIVPIALVARVEEVIADYSARLDEAVALLVENYDRLIERDERELGAVFARRDYPGANELRGSFGIETEWEATSVPVALKQIKQALFAREKAKAERRWADASDEIRAGLRAGFMDLVSRLGERLAPATDGKRTVLKSSLVEGLREFLDLFSAKNLTDDRALSALVSKARCLVDGVSPDDLRRSEDVRTEVQRGLGEIAKIATTLVDVRSRKIAI